MFKFLRKRTKQQSDEETRDGEDDETSADDQEQSLNHLEVVLNRLFERIKPTAPEEYVGMHNSRYNVKIICDSQIQCARYYSVH